MNLSPKKKSNHPTNLQFNWVFMKYSIVESGRKVAEEQGPSKGWCFQRSKQLRKFVQQLQCHFQNLPSLKLLLMEEILHQLISSLSHCLQGFIHPRWISSISKSPSKSPKKKCLSPKHPFFQGRAFWESGAANKCNLQNLGDANYTPLSVRMFQNYPSKLEGFQLEQ